MKIAIMQPTYLPWVGYFDLIDQVDHFVFLDDVQLTKRSWQVRNRIKTPQGEFYLSVPVEKAPRDTLLHQAKVKNALGWRVRHLQNIEQHYRKANHYAEVAPQLKEALSLSDDSLADSNIHLIETLAKILNLGTQFSRSSTLRSNPASKGDGLIELCQLVGATAYFSPLGSAAYLEGEGSSDDFAQAGIELPYQHYAPASYRQLHGEFIPYLSVIDLLLNEGSSTAHQVVQAGAKEPLTPAQVRARLAL